MSELNLGWQPLSTYDALEVKPAYAVFFFPAQQSDGGALPAEIRTSRECTSRVCTLWQAIQAPRMADVKEKPQTHADINLKSLNPKQIAALALLSKGKADFHAAFKVGANLSSMSALVKAGLASVTQDGAIKQWEITDRGLAALRAAEKPGI